MLVTMAMVVLLMQLLELLADHVACFPSPPLSRGLSDW